MNKQQMLNGMSEEEFYNLYPTEEDYIMAMGGQAGNDDFYVPHQDADRLRASTPINFINTPYYNLGGASDGPLGYFQEGGSPFNYGAFPVMVGGGEFNMIINDLLQKQFGGVDTKNQAPSTDSVIESNRNFFNAYIRNNVGKALAEEMKNDFQQQMMAGAYMQDGGTFANPYANANTGITGYNEDLSMQYQIGGPAMDRADVNARTVECSPMEKMDPNSQCYDPNFFEQGVAQNKQQFNFDFSTPQGSFDAQGNQTADPYGKMPQVDNSYFASQSPNYGQELFGATPQQDVGTWDINNPNAPQAPKSQTWNMDPNQMRTQEPSNNTTGANQGQPINWMSMMPDGIDAANQILNTMDFVSSRLEARQNKKQEKANKWRFSGDANFVAKPQTSSSRGDYDVNSGMFRPDQYVPVQFRGNNMGNVGSPYYTAQYGGSSDNKLNYFDSYGLPESVDTTNLYKNPYFPEYTKGPDPKTYDDASKLAQQIKYQQYLEYKDKMKNEFNFSKEKGKLVKEMFTYQDGGVYNGDEEVYMSDEDIQQFLASGGQLEILD